MGKREVIIEVVVGVLRVGTTPGLSAGVSVLCEFPLDAVLLMQFVCEITEGK